MAFMKRVWEGWEELGSSSLSPHTFLSPHSLPFSPRHRVPPLTASGASFFPFPTLSILHSLPPLVLVVVERVRLDER
jgi:hypothetical protein